MKIMKRKSSLMFAMLLVALLAVSGINSLNTKKVEASGPQQSKTSKSDLPTKTKSHTPHAPSGAMPPANDNCANAINVTGANCPFTDTKDTSNATDEANEPQSTCTLQANSVWYNFTTGSQTAIVTVSTCNSAPVDTALMAYKVNGAACDFANFVPVACNDDFCGDGFQSTLSFTADPNATYKIQVGGFDGDSGSITTDITCQVLNCPPVVINGTLGTGDPAFTGTQTHGNQLGRLNRNGIGSSCAAPKVCDIFDPANLRAYDAYSIPNQSGQDVCVSINLDAPSNTTCNLQSNAYLNTYNPNSICTGYLGDPGLSTGVPPTATNFSVVVPAGQTLIVVVHTTNPGETGCAYTLTLLGDLCAGFDLCVQQDAPKRFLQMSTITGKYRYTDCSKNIIRDGVGAASTYFCKIDFSGFGVNSSATALVNPCTKRGDATIVVPLGTTTQVVKITDKDVTNNDCKCATP